MPEEIDLNETEEAALEAAWQNLHPEPPTPGSDDNESQDS